MIFQAWGEKFYPQAISMKIQFMIDAHLGVFESAQSY